MANNKENRPILEEDRSRETHQEIERKFLVNFLPDNLEEFSKEEISQGYISAPEDEVEIRVRKRGDQYFQTIKRSESPKDQLTREEVEIEITKDQFDSLWPTTTNKRLEKTRYTIPHGDLSIELDIFAGHLNGLLMAEVEFDSREEAEKFIPPEWLGEEVTENTDYRNKNLARQMPRQKKERILREEETGIPEYNLEQGVSQLISMVQEKVGQQTGPVVIEIAGGSASGKTSAVAAKLKEHFGEEAIIISMDNYYRGKTFMNEEAEKGNVLNWDQPEALNLPLLRKHLSELKEGRPIEQPIYSFKTGEVTETEEIKPSRVVIVEGLFALDDSVKEEGQVRAFVDIGTHGRILRRLLRDVERTGQKPADILRYFAETVEPMHEKYIQSTKKNADIVIRNEYSPEVESGRSGLHEVQVKFKIDLIDNDALRRMGAERLGSMTQTDRYYNPGDRNLVETGEILRIREEDESIILTYKGPKMESSFRKRPKFEFEIDSKIEEKFLSIYGDKTKTIKKRRTLYQLDGLIFSIDQVSKVENGKEINLGSFIEIRSIDDNDQEDRVNDLLKKIGIETNQAIRESYFEM